MESMSELFFIILWLAVTISLSISKKHLFSYLFKYLHLSSSPLFLLYFLSYSFPWLLAPQTSSTAYSSVIIFFSFFYDPHSLVLCPASTSRFPLESVQTVWLAVQPYFQMRSEFTNWDCPFLRCTIQSLERDIILHMWPWICLCSYPLTHHPLQVMYVKQSLL